MKPKPWYRQFWPWFVFALPALAVVASVTSAVIAIRTQDAVVDPDYYAHGRDINRELAKRERLHEAARPAPAR